jgi:hypothetical protein
MLNGLLNLTLEELRLLRNKYWIINL